MGRTVIGVEEAMAAVMNGENVFITGPAGCGKSTMISTLREFFSDSFLFVAPTGISALNIGGITAHRAFGLTFGITTREDYKARSKKSAMLMSSDALDGIVVDEISMIRSDKLKEIDMKLRHHRKVNKPFGGLQVVAFGDGFQIRPVLKGCEVAPFREEYGNEIPFGSDTWNDLDFTCAYLPKVYRQVDLEFSKHLNNIRVGNNIPGAVDYLNKNCFGAPLTDAVTICTTNKAADNINTQEFNKLPAESHQFKATISGEFTERPVSETMDLKEGLKVMIVVNDSAEKRGGPEYVNGTVGIITKISKSHVIVSINGKPVAVGKNEWKNVTQVPQEKMVPVEKEVVKSDGSKEVVRTTEKQTVLVDKEVGRYLQFPFKLGYAITGHKCVSEDSIITTPSGHKKIKDVLVGDIVDTGISGFKKVKAVLNTGRKRALLIKTLSGCEVVSSPDHLFWVSSNNTTPTFDPASNLEVGDYLGISARWVAEIPEGVELQGGKLFNKDDVDSGGYFWDRVVSVERTTATDMYDIEIEGGNTFSCGGVIVHNCQGLTLEKVNIDMGFGAFSPGQAYVMLSRATEVGGLRLLRKLRVKDIIIDNEVLSFYRDKFPQIFIGGYYD